MVHMLVRHKVEEFGKWKPIYDEHQEARAAAGLKDLHLWHNIDDPNERSGPRFSDRSVRWNPLS